ncbi:hypothetical protein [Chryseobacterium wanjuense]
MGAQRIISDAFFIALTYAAARFGQHKGKDEMLKLRRFAEESTLQFEKR